MVQLQTGAIHLMQAVPAESMDTVRKDARFRIGPTPQANVYRMYMNFGRSPFTNLQVRQAMNYAVDVDAIIEAKGLRQVSDTGVVHDITGTGADTHTGERPCAGGRRSRPRCTGRRSGRWPPPPGAGSVLRRC
mgnify:CR=1 FL=1